MRHSFSGMIIILYNLMSYVYYNYIGKRFNYIEYNKFENEFDFKKFILGFILLFIILILGRSIKNKFTLSIYIIFTIFYFLPSLVFNVFNHVKYYSIFGNILILSGIIFTRKIKFKFSSRMTFKSEKKTMVCLSTICLITSLLFCKFYGNYFDLSNLILKDIYLTRAKFREISYPLLGYIFGITSKIIAPTLLVLGIKYKKIKHIIISIGTLIILFLSGALKSVFFGMILTLIFYSGDYDKKIKKILFGTIIINLIGIVENIYFNSTIILNIIRRVFFVPSYLENKYYSFFYPERLTYASHSFFKIFMKNEYLPSITRYFGEKVMKLDGFNANIGVVTDGGISFGIFGMVVFAYIIVIFIVYLRCLNINTRYFGLIVVYIYYFNTSILSTLLITHGLLFFIIFSRFFLSENKKIYKYYTRREK